MTQPEQSPTIGLNYSVCHCVRWHIIHVWKDAKRHCFNLHL